MKKGSFAQKALLFVLLIALFFAPFQASAGFGDSVRNSILGSIAGCIGALYLGLGIWGCTAGAGLGAVGGGSDAAGAKIIGWITDAIDSLAEFTFGVLLPFAAALLSYAIALSTAKVTDFQPIVDGAAVTTGIANLLLIAALIIIAIATIVGIETYGVRQRLPWLIAIVLIVNFSTIIVGVVADAGNTILRFFYTNSAFATTPIDQYVVKNMNLSTTLAQQSVATIEGVLAARGSPVSARGAQIIKAALYGVVLYLTYWALYLFLRLSYIFLMRIGVFWILIISAPVAFIAGTLPVGQEYFQRWWRELLHWSFIGPILFFLFFFGVIIWTQLNIILTGGTSLTGIRIPFATPAYAAGDVSAQNLQALSIFFIFPIVGLFFKYAISLSKKAANAFSDVGVSGARTLLRSAGEKGRSVIGTRGKAGVNNYLLSSQRVGQLAKRLQRTRFGRNIGSRLSNAHEKAARGYTKNVSSESRAWENVVNAGNISSYLKGKFRSPTQRQAIALAALRKNVPLSREDYEFTKRIATPGMALEKGLQSAYLHYDKGLKGASGELDLRKVAQRITSENINTQLMLQGASEEEVADIGASAALAWDRADWSRVVRERPELLTQIREFQDSLRETRRISPRGYEDFLTRIASKTGRSKEEVQGALDEQHRWTSTPHAIRAAQRGSASAT